MKEHVDCRSNTHSPNTVLCITPWERDVLQLLADGRTASDLSGLLELSASVIDLRLERLFASLGAATSTDAVAAAHKRGLLRREPVPVAAAV